MVGIPQPEKRLKAHPAPVLGRDAPARDDRDGAGPGAAADDRRRADDRARRDDPGPGAGADLAAHHRLRDVADPDHARPRGRRRNDRPDQRDVCRVHRRDARRRATCSSGRPTRTPSGCCTRSRGWTSARASRSSPSRGGRPTCATPRRDARSRPAAHGGSSDAGPTTRRWSRSRPARASSAPGPQPTHRTACHNPPTPDEAEAGRPLRAGHEPAPAPAGRIDELSGVAVPVGLLSDETAPSEPAAAS